MRRIKKIIIPKRPISKSNGARLFSDFEIKR
jgi:hypothetical protein